MTSHRTTTGTKYLVWAGVHFFYTPVCGTGNRHFLVVSSTLPRWRAARALAPASYYLYYRLHATYLPAPACQTTTLPVPETFWISSPVRPDIFVVDTCSAATTTFM